MAYDINELLAKAYEKKASDLHIIVDSKPIYRVNGSLQAYGDSLLTREQTEQMAKILIQNEQMWQRLLDQRDLDFSYSIEQVARYRVNIYYERQRLSIAARVIPATIPTIEQLQMPLVLQQLAKKPQGLILVTGPTGSGKSTTLAAMIDYVNRHQAKNIITLEDPIEYLHKHQRSIISQREISLDAKNFTNGLRAALRQGPDIILVGEMRDLETISTAMTAAETGHLVLATLHTSSAAQTINRIINVFPPFQQGQIRLQLASVLEGVISQRLFPRADENGRIAATELLIRHPSVANLIRNEKVHQLNNVMQTGRALGMHTLEMSIRSLLSAGTITYEAAELYMNLGENYASL